MFPRFWSACRWRLGDNSESPSHKKGMIAVRAGTSAAEPGGLSVFGQIKWPSLHLKHMDPVDYYSGVCYLKSCRGPTAIIFTWEPLWKTSKNEIFSDPKLAGFQLSVVAAFHCKKYAICCPVAWIDPFGCTHTHTHTADGHKECHANLKKLMFSVVKSFQTLLLKDNHVFFPFIYLFFLWQTVPEMQHVKPL